MTTEQIAHNLSDIRTQIADAAVAAGRNVSSIKLCAVSKFHPVESIYSAIESGQLLFGENRVQEAYEKFSLLKKDTALPTKPVLHIIGSLQLNKVKHAVEIASCIQSVDRKELLDEIEKQCKKQNKQITVFFELHTGEESKSGYRSIDDLRESVELCAKGTYTHIIPQGLMTMAPFTENTTVIHKSFSMLRETAMLLNKEFPEIPLTELSMGMSNDFKIAIEEGSTMVRIGTAIFGQRETNIAKD